MNRNSFILILFCLSFIENHASGSICYAPKPEILWKKAPKIFVGHVVEGDVVLTGDAAAGQQYEPIVKFRVSKSLKGNVPKTTEVFRTGYRIKRKTKPKTRSAVIGIPTERTLFEIGKEYLVFAYMRKDGKLVPGECDSSVELPHEKLAVIEKLAKTASTTK